MLISYDAKIALYTLYFGCQFRYVSVLSLTFPLQSIRLGRQPCRPLQVLFIGLFGTGQTRQQGFTLLSVIFFHRYMIILVCTAVERSKVNTSLLIS